MGLRSYFVRIFSQSQSWFRSVVQRDRLESEMEAELADHLEHLTAELVRMGHSPQEAARRARIALGASTVNKEGMRASLGLRWWDEFWADLRYGCVSCARAPDSPPSPRFLLRSPSAPTPPSSPSPRV